MISVNLASSELRNANLRRAMALLLTADEVFQRSFGVDHPQNAVALIILGTAYRRAGDHRNERAVLDRALRLRWSAFGPRDLRTIEVVRHLVAALADLSATDSSEMIEASVLARVRDAVDGQASLIGRSRFGPERADRELAAYLDRALEPRPDPGRTPIGTYGQLRSMSIDEVVTATGDSSDWRWFYPLRRLAHERQQEGRRADSLRISELAVGIMARVYGSDHLAIIYERTRLGTALTEEFGPRAGLPAFWGRRRGLRLVAGSSRRPGRQSAGPSSTRGLAPTGARPRWDHDTPAPCPGESDRAASILGALDDLDHLVERRDLQEWTAIKAELPLLLADDPYVLASASAGLARLLFEGGLHSSAGATIVALARVAARPDHPANARAAGLCVSILAAARERPGRRPAWVKRILELGDRELDGWREFGLGANRPQRSEPS
jgi:Tetratricopeptide repeat